MRACRSHTGQVGADGPSRPTDAEIRRRTEVLLRQCETAVAITAKTVEASHRRMESAGSHITSSRVRIDRAQSSAQGFANRFPQNDLGAKIAGIWGTSASNTRQRVSDLG